MLGRHDRTPRLKSLARQLRQQSTDAERKLWALLRVLRIADDVILKHPDAVVATIVRELTAAEPSP